MRKIYKSGFYGCVALILGAALAYVVSCCNGCSSKDEAPAYSRSNDVAYNDQLKNSVKEQQALAKPVARTRAKLGALIERAKAALPEGATAQQIEAELAGHPEKYPEWESLKKELAANEKALGQHLESVRNNVRARILKENADIRKAAETK